MFIYILFIFIYFCFFSFLFLLQIPLERMRVDEELEHAAPNETL